MIIFQVPIGSGEILKVISGWIKELFLMRHRKNVLKKKFNFVYFSYAPDFEYLCLSIKSLIRNVHCEYAITVFIDQKAPFTSEQEQIIRRIYSDVVFYPVENFSWASISTTMAELSCFLKVAEESSEDDYLVKTDSDILFLSGDKFERIATSNLKAIGDGRHINYKYFQGGLYIIQNKVIKNCFSNIQASDMEDIAQRWNGNLGEDLAVTQRLKDKGIKPFESRLMLFPSEYKKLKYANKFVRRDFVALHFVRDKESMKEYFENFI
ncbi:hypothetical protein QX776_17725 [Alteromonadaceae bacterium BrNp21-10]|nr:hypothetical protein [Alteromonadaceae bacterium BrNp21-10]